MFSPVVHFYTHAARRIDALPMAKRLMLFFGSIVVLLGAFYLFQYSPNILALKAQKRHYTRTLSSRDSIKKKMVWLAFEEAKQEQSPDYKRYKAAQSKLATAMVATEKMVSTLISPAEQGKTLRTALKREEGLKAAHIKREDAVDVLTSSVATGKRGSKDDFMMYVHPVTVSFDATYSKTYSVLQQLSRLKQRLLYGNLKYSVSQYPTAKVQFTVYTLSKHMELHHEVLA